MKTNKPAVVAAIGSVVDPRVWATELDAVAGRISDRLARPEAAECALDPVGGLISDLERKNCWTIAERAGHPSPHAFQHLLAQAVWDADGVRDDLRSYVTEGLPVLAPCTLERQFRSPGRRRATARNRGGKRSGRPHTPGDTERAAPRE